MKKTHTLIIGGGPAGLSLAYGLPQDTMILEKEERVGGLCRSIENQGGVFDIGGHSFHTPHPEVSELFVALQEESIFSQKREATVFSHGMIIPYPFQKYFDQLPDKAVVEACEAGLKNAKGKDAPADNFEDFIINQFGEGIAEHFMLPYNKKLWARDIKNISCEWTSERVAKPKGHQEKFDTAGGKRKPLQPNTHVAYPANGGFEKFFSAFLPKLQNVRTNIEVVRVDPKNKIVFTAQGEEIGYEQLVSTVPIPEFLDIVDDTPDAIKSLAAGLEYMSLRVEFILVGKKLQTSIQRIYVADPNIPPHKIALNHNSSDFLRERDVHGIMAEVSFSDEKKVDFDQIAPKTINFLVEAGILDSEEDVIWTGHEMVKYAYPVYTHQRPGLVKGIKDHLKQFDIFTLGRFGDWEYINSDKCVMKGIKLSEELAVPLASMQSA